ncbi:hypothetical protein M3484_00960 [Pseudomonas sp. GX19020]|uniref:hypothetical protein n=1 Tax=Pseudomonadota TaxID=1224 RepID=UPI000895D77B|nr:MULTISPECIES: hypothetical protein [Pseudomonadota]MBJ2151705.1 hypothetical protein [Paracoccus sp. IB05]MCL4065145.1 hypothetical protein [Pseudomonas sp. GX19020]SEB93580.1 hypothetical protein SAMN05519105_1616 [Rhodobacter sp. 24-YEA-8]
MNITVWLLRAKRWVQNPPPMKRVLLVLGVIAACLAFAAFEWIWGWPDWLRVNRMRF